MEGHFHNRIRVAVACVLLVTAANAAGAQENQAPPDWNRDTRVLVYTEPTAAVVEAELDQSSAPIESRATNRPKRSCRLESISTDPGPGPGNPQNLALPTKPDQEPYWLICEAATVAIIWRNINRTPRPSSAAPAEVALRLREEIPMPEVTIRMNPDVGLVGSESWFWIEGYAGQAITNSTDAFGQPVEIDARVTGYQWAFGDGTVVSASSTGTPYPQRSEIRHVYERSSAGLQGGFLLEVRFQFAVRYRVAGGPWIDLPSITRVASSRYPVKESQAVISR